METGPGPASPDRKNSRGRGSVGSSILFLVDLGLLEPAGKIAVDHLPLGVELERAAPPSRLARSQSGPLRPAERKLDFRPDGRRVDIDQAGIEVPLRDGG